MSSVDVVDPKSKKKRSVDLPAGVDIEIKL